MFLILLSEQGPPVLVHSVSHVTRGLCPRGKDGVLSSKRSPNGFSVSSGSVTGFYGFPALFAFEPNDLWLPAYGRRRRRQVEIQKKKEKFEIKFSSMEKKRVSRIACVLFTGRFRSRVSPAADVYNCTFSKTIDLCIVVNELRAD